MSHHLDNGANITKDEGTANPSFAYSLLTKYKDNEDKGVPNQLTLKDIQGASGAVFIAGSNTVSFPLSDRRAVANRID